MDASVTDGIRYEFGSFILDPTRRLLTHQGAVVGLSPTLFETLLYLVEHSGRVVSRDELMDAVWPRKVVEEANVSQTIFTLRKALSAAGAPSRLIATQPGQGYRFAEAVQVRTRSQAKSGEPAPVLEAPSAASTPGPPAAHGLRWSRTLAIGLGALVLIAVALVAARRFWWPADAAATGNVVVVLGEFQNLSGEPLFNRTLTEATRVDLLQSPYIAVLPEQKVQDTLVLMTRSRDDPITPAVAREVCQRNNGYSAISGSIAQVGTRYLMTLSATDCADGQTLYADKAEVASKDALLTALDGLVTGLRQRMGESPASTRRFGVPLLQARTASLEALQAYSEARYRVDHGKRTEAIPLFQHAIDIDPDFAAAYSDLSLTYYNIKEGVLAAQDVAKAYALRQKTDERERLRIEVAYNTIVTGDVEAGIRILRATTEVYPNDATAWANLANKESWIGHYDDAIQDGRRAVALAPDTETAYVVLARAYLHAGRVDEARSVCRDAIARKLDGDDLHGVLYQMAFAVEDYAAADRELAWARGKAGERWMLIEAGQGAFRRGQVRRGLELFAEALEKGKSYGLRNYLAAPNARLLNDMGLIDLARQSLAQVPAGYDSGDYRVTLAAIGDAEQADMLLAADLAKAPSDTLLTQVYAAEQRAASALRQGRPADAIEALKPALPYEARTFDVPYLRGIAYLAASDGAHAATEFLKILDHPGIEAVSVHYPLARLGLARAYAQQGDVARSRAAYEHFFADWKDADPALPLVQAARTEYTRLQHPA